MDQLKTINREEIGRGWSLGRVVVEPETGRANQDDPRTCYPRPFGPRSGLLVAAPAEDAFSMGPDQELDGWAAFTPVRHPSFVVARVGCVSRIFIHQNWKIILDISSSPSVLRSGRCL